MAHRRNPQMKFNYRVCPSVDYFCNRKEFLVQETSSADRRSRVAKDAERVDLYLLDRDLAAPPGSPADGDTCLVAASPTGPWTGHAGEIAFCLDGAWRFYPGDPFFNSTT